MALNDEYVAFAQKLLDKTEVGKVPWQATYDAAVFVAVLDEYSCEIRNERAGYTLTMKDKADIEMFSLTGYTPTVDTSPAVDRIHNLLEELYERARRTALDIDKKVAKASSFLDKL